MNIINDVFRFIIVYIFKYIPIYNQFIIMIMKLYQRSSQTLKNNNITQKYYNLKYLLDPSGDRAQIESKSKINKIN